MFYMGYFSGTTPNHSYWGITNARFCWSQLEYLMTNLSSRQGCCQLEDMSVCRELTNGGNMDKHCSLITTFFSFVVACQLAFEGSLSSVHVHAQK